MNEKEEFLKELGITDIVDIEKGLTEDLETDDEGVSVVVIPDSEKFGKIYSKLEDSDLVRQDDESSQVTYDTISVQYLSDKYLLTLLGDLEADNYRLTIKEG